MVSRKQRIFILELARDFSFRCNDFYNGYCYGLWRVKHIDICFYRCTCSDRYFGTAKNFTQYFKQADSRKQEKEK